MAEQEDSVISSLYPPPPPYIKFFTQENLDKLPGYIENKERAVDNEDSSLPSEMDFLIPPPLPEGDSYRSFGNIWQVNEKLPDLESMGMTQLYKTPTAEEDESKVKITELKKLLKSLLLNFLELIGILSVNPELFPERIENMRTILVNIHHLLNEYRPHQSRESLIMMLEQQVETKKNEIQEIRDTCKDIEEKLKKLVAEHIDGVKTEDIEMQDVSEEKPVV